MWKFDAPRLAFAAGFMQSTAVFIVAILNYYTIVAATEVIDVVMNFLALLVIAEIDDFFFEAHSPEELGRKMVHNEDGEYDELYRIETTTSKHGKANTNANKPWLNGLNLF